VLYPKIIFEDEEILVLDKPSGWVVNESRTTKNIKTIQKFLRENFNYSLSQSFEKRSGIVHRLDKETSGILLVAKTSQSFSFLQQEFKKRMVDKVYIALLHGKLEIEEGEIRVPISRLSWNRRKFGVIPGGKESYSLFRLKEIFKLPDRGSYFSLVWFYPKTGRTHQIRVQAKYLGHPIVSDQVYAGRKTYRADIKFCPRLFLHAERLAFLHPKTKKKVSFESPLPSDLKTTLSLLEKIPQKT